MSSKYSILYVDDEEINLRTFKMAFRRSYDIYLASSGEEGINVLENNTADIVITDQMMPKMTGVEFLAKICELYPDNSSKRIIVSGYTQSEQIERAYKDFELFQFIAKPWKKEELEQVFNKALAS